MRLYAYCLSEEATPETLEGVAGVDGVRPRLIRKGALALVVSEFEGERVAVTRENVRAHGRVIASVMRQATPLPFRFGTVAAEERLGNYLRTHEGALRASLVRVRGCVEMSVKIIWDAGAVRREVEEIGEEARAVGVGRGAAFLAAKQRELSGDEKLKERAEALAARLEARVADVVRESSVSVRPSESLVVRAAHLVETARLEEYRARLKALGSESGEREIRFLTSGAWPPYSFSDVRS